MELIERAGFLTSLLSSFDHVARGEGHCILLGGEAGMGKTSLVRAFCKEIKSNCKIYQGTCDALFSPRPLAPLYDIIWQMGSDIRDNDGSTTDRAALFSRFLYELEYQKGTTVIVIEDIHWADEATLDFIKFFVRRITRVHSLFIVTYRDDEIHSRHPLRSVFGQLPPDAFTRMQLTPLSKQVVEQMAVEKGYRGEDVFTISGGNPFYVNEILASYSPGVPENIKDSILSVYMRMDENAKHIWQILSVLPTAFEIKYLEKMEPSYASAIENYLDLKILILDKGLISFKHELYRRTIESSLSPLVRLALNKKILELFRESFEANHEIERIIHHAKNANDYDLVVSYAPLAAGQASNVGAHIEAAKLYFSAIEYYRGNDQHKLVQFYEAYAYECYLTNQIKEGIIYQERALKIWKEKNDIEKTGNCMRFLSRLWWFDGNSKKAENYASQAIEALEDQLFSKAKAMAYSNMSQLKMLSDDPEECIFWGEKAIAMAKELADDEILCHALNNVGEVRMKIQSTRQLGIELLKQSLEIALKNSYQDHAARAYANMGSGGLVIKDYVFAKKALNDGIEYCEERDLDLWITYMLSEKARLYLATGNFGEAYSIADNLIQDEGQAPLAKIGALTVVAKIKIRRGDADALPLLMEAKEIAFNTMELQWIIPVLVTLLESEWITGKSFIEGEALNSVMNMVKHMGNVYENNELAFWLLKARKQQLRLRESYAGYQMYTHAKAKKAASLWEHLGCPYEQALALFEGNETDKKHALAIVKKLGANATFEKMKLEMRTSGIKNIPRGIRKSTQSNPANLTDRELDVLQLLKEGLQNKEIAARLFISPKTVDHHISSIFFKLDVNSRAKAIREAIHLAIIK